MGEAHISSGQPVIRKSMPLSIHSRDGTGGSAIVTAARRGHSRKSRWMLVLRRVARIFLRRGAWRRARKARERLLTAMIGKPVIRASGTITSMERNLERQTWRDGAVTATLPEIVAKRATISPGSAGVWVGSATYDRLAKIISIIWTPSSRVRSSGRRPNTDIAAFIEQQQKLVALLERRKARLVPRKDPPI